MRSTLGVYARGGEPLLAELGEPSVFRNRAGLAAYRVRTRFRSGWIGSDTSSTLVWTRNNNFAPSNVTMPSARGLVSRFVLQALLSCRSPLRYSISSPLRDRALDHICETRLHLQPTSAPHLYIYYDRGRGPCPRSTTSALLFQTTSYQPGRKPTTLLPYIIMQHFSRTWVRSTISSFHAFCKRYPKLPSPELL